MLQYLGPLLDGLTVTLKISAGAVALAVPAALAAGLARLAPWRTLR